MPLTFDLPFEELLGYAGTNPKPPDFDAFWQVGLEEMRRVQPAIEIKPAGFGTSFCECFDLCFGGVSGARGRAGRQPGWGTDHRLRRAGTAHPPDCTGIPFLKRLPARVVDGPGQGCLQGIAGILPPLRSCT